MSPSPRVAANGLARAGRYWLSLGLLFHLATAAAAHESLWIEAEHFEGVRGYCWPMGPEAIKKTDGHWGLSGMRARAEHLGGKLRLLSGPAAGTEVELLVPGHIAFASKPSSGISKWLGRWRLKWKPAIRESEGGHNS